jgi:hypothetical protein
MDENDIVKTLKEEFKIIDNSVLKFVNYTSDRTEIVVKGTVEEWRKFFDGHK